MEDEKPSCSYTFSEGSKKTGGFSQVDFEEIDSSSDWTSLEEEETRLPIDTERDDDTDSSLSGTRCTERKDEELSYDADCSESEDEGKVRKLQYKGTERGKLTGTFQNQDVPKGEDGNNTKKKRDKSTACLSKVFSQQKQPKPNGENRSLDANLTVQRDEKPHKCSECGKSYLYKSYLRKHKISHLKEKPYKCSECGKNYAYKKSLSYHKKSHLKEKPYKCPECGKSYVYQKTLRYHEKTHLNEKYKCSVCGKSYVYKSNLRRHEKSHLKEKLHKH